MWTLERIIRAGLLKEKDEPSVNGIDFYSKVWVPNGCTLNVYHDGYHEFIHHVYQGAWTGELRFVTSGSNDHVERRDTMYLPVMTDKTVDWVELYDKAVEYEVREREERIELENELYGSFWKNLIKKTAKRIEQW